MLNPPNLQVNSSSTTYAGELTTSGSSEVFQAGETASPDRKVSLDEEKFEDLSEFEQKEKLIKVRDVIYIKSRMLGKGKFAEVFRARNQNTKQLVALKIQFLDDADKRMTMQKIHSLKQELRALRSITHNNVIKLIGYDPQVQIGRAKKKRPCMICVQELCSRGELFGYISYKGKFKEPIARHIFKQYIAGLKACHDKGIAHRDLKPDNVFLTRDWVVKIGDFGFAKRFRRKEGQGRVAMDTPLGTPGYMAPEVMARCLYKESSDIFSSGVILFIMLAGYPPLRRAVVGDWWFDRLANRNYARFWEAHERDKSFSKRAKAIIQGMLTIRPNERWTMKQIIESEFMTTATPETTVTKEQYINFMDGLKAKVEAGKLEETKDVRDPDMELLEKKVAEMHGSKPILLKDLLCGYRRSHLKEITNDKGFDELLKDLAASNPNFKTLENVVPAMPAAEAAKRLETANTAEEIQAVLPVDLPTADFVKSCLDQPIIPPDEVMTAKILEGLGSLCKYPLPVYDADLDELNITTYRLRCGFDTINYALRLYTKNAFKRENAKLHVLQEEGRTLVSIKLSKPLPLPDGESEDPVNLKVKMIIEVQCFQIPNSADVYCRLSKWDEGYITAPDFTDFCTRLFFHTLMKAFLVKRES